MFGKQIVQGAAGGMHSAAVTTSGEVACRPPPDPVRFFHGAAVMTTVLAVIFLASSAVPTLHQLFARLTTDEDCEFFPGLAQGLEHRQQLGHLWGIVLGRGLRWVPGSWQYWGA